MTEECIAVGQNTEKRIL